jgi:predicted dehydrogenase
VTDDVRIAVVGLGYWGPNVLRNAWDVDGCEVIVGCDREIEALARQARRYPPMRLTTSFQDVLEAPDVDGVALITPIQTHYALARRALDAGKHVLVEKPLAGGVKECEELIHLATERGLVLMPGHTFLYSPPVNAVKNMLDTGELGEIYFLTSSRVNLGIHQRDASVVRDLGPHDFSILLYWFGQAPTSVQATGRAALASGIADIAFVAMSFPGGIVANVELSWLAPSKLRRTVLVGSEKMVVYDDGSPEPIRVFDRGIVLGAPESFGEYHLSYRSGDIVCPQLENCEPLVAELAEFVRAIRQDERLPWELTLARDVVRITEAAERSLVLGGTAVALAEGAAVLEPAA